MFLSKITGLFGAKSKLSDNKVPQLVYGAVVAQSRNSAFYTQIQIPDAVMGRYAMLALHVFLLNHRLKSSDSNASELNGDRQLLSQLVFDLFVIDLERGLRDLGFADTSVHKRKKKLVHSYYALIEEFDHLLDGQNIAELEKNVEDRYFSDGDIPFHKTSPAILANYMLRATHTLKSQPDKALLNGIISWPKIIEEQS